MSAKSIWVRADELEELERLTRAQLAATRSGDLESLEALLDMRRGILDRLHGQRVRSGALQGCLLHDAETRVLLEAWVHRVVRDLAQLRQGGQALSGYALPVGAPAGFIEEYR